MPQIDSGDTAWLLVSTALVMLMVPGLALFYGGMVQAKNVLSVFVHCFAAVGLVTVQWALIGYSLAFAPSAWGFIGGLDFALLRGVGVEPRGQVPHLIFMSYQGMFAAISPALIAGAIAERMRFAAFCTLTVLWTTLVYDPLAHWAWAADGWLNRIGSLDFAGGTVVHLSSGISALVAAIVVGPRSHHLGPRQLPHNLPMTTLGTGLLWFGWFGFNGAAGGNANGIAGLAAANSQLAAASGMLGWGLIERWRHRKVSILGLCSGAVAGLVGITPAAGYVTPLAALAIGGSTGLVCFAGVLLKRRLGYDDALDAFGVHGVGGAFGAVATGVFAAAWINPQGADGLLLGQPVLLVKQLLSVVVAGVYAAVVTWAILWVIGRTIGLRATADGEREGLDTALHGETGYVWSPTDRTTS